MAILVPLVYGVYLTFTDWNGISKEKNIVGIENYLTAFTEINGGKKYEKKRKGFSASACRGFNGQ